MDQDDLSQVERRGLGRERPHLVISGTSLQALDEIDLDPELEARGGLSLILPGAGRTRTPAFRSWFGASRVREPRTSSRQVQEDQPPLRVFHGTNRPLEAFTTGLPTVNDYGWLGLIETTRHAAFFAEDPRYAETFIKGHKEGGSVIPAYLAIQNPFYLDQQSLSDYYGDMAEKLDLAYDQADAVVLEAAKGDFSRARWLYNLRDVWEVFDGEEGRAFVAWLMGQGHDGAFLEEEAHGLAPDAPRQRVWAVFEPGKVKSATGNCGRYDPSNPDLRA